MPSSGSRAMRTRLTSCAEHQPTSPRKAPSTLIPSSVPPPARSCPFVGGAFGVPRSATREESGARAAAPPGDHTHCFDKLEATLQSASVTRAPVSMQATAAAGASRQ